MNARKKGQRGEKMAIAFLKKWTKMDFARTPSSGGLRWKKADNISGDIVCIERNYIFPLSIEVKFVRDINFEHLLYHRPDRKSGRLVSRIEEFWMQATADGERAEKIPMLMMRYNGMPKDFFFVVLSKLLYSAIVIANSPGKDEMGLPILKMIRPYLCYSKGVFITTSDALAKVNWKKVEEAAYRVQNDCYGKEGC
jgi:hypothetical protein